VKKHCAECDDITPNNNQSTRECNNMEFIYAALINLFKKPFNFIGYAVFSCAWKKLCSLR